MHPRNQKKHLIWSMFSTCLKVTAIVAIVGSVWGAINLRSIDECRDAWDKRNQYAGEVEQLETEIAQMEREAEQLERRGFAEEAAARERFKLVKPGERVIFIEWE